MATTPFPPDNQEASVEVFRDNQGIFSSDYKMTGEADGLLAYAVDRFHETLERHGSDFSSEVLEEADELAAEGLDVQVVETPDILTFRGLEARKNIIKAVTSLMVRAAGIYDPKEEKTSLLYRIPTARRWYGQSGTALAINAGVLGRRDASGVERKSNFFCDGIDPESFESPYFIKKDANSYTTSMDGEASEALSAKDILVEGGADASVVDEAVESHKSYVKGRIGPVGRLFLDGLSDMEGVRTRISLGVKMMEEALEDHPKDVPLHLASLGSGSALPVIEIIRNLREKGYAIGKYHLVDSDPLAMAAAVSALKNSGLEGLEDVLEIHLGDLGRTGEGIDGIDPGSVHAADALGLYEYLRDKFARRFIKSCSSILKEDGSLCLTNMHPGRSQKEFFERLIRWQPTVQQRTMREILTAVQQSGMKEMKIRLGNKGSVYPGYIVRK